MCGIICVLGSERPFVSLSHRGPDNTKRVNMGKCYMEFYRLAINDLSVDGDQPFVTPDSIFMCNGEIYNHSGFDERKNDCAFLPEFIEKFGIKGTLTAIRGEYAMVWSDGNRVIAARDQFGVRPLFYSRGVNGTSMCFASEIKALKGMGKPEIFPPGTFYDSLLDSFVTYFTPYSDNPICDMSYVYQRDFEQAVKRRVENTEREVGFLLSGGLDSSLVVAVAKKLFPKKKLVTFSIGQIGSPDVVAARKVANHFNTTHHEVEFNFNAGLSAIPTVIKSIESYDTTTVRASVPMWLLCQWIKENTNVRVILSGEGSDELFGGYKYFKNAPNNEEFHLETIRRLILLHQFDVLRTDRCTAAHGLEVRVPFLDIDFTESVVRTSTRVKNTPEEKKVLRDTFVGYLPNEILRRPKDAFSDAVGYSWIQTTRDFCENRVSDSEFEEIKIACRGHNVPTSKEEAYYRGLFMNYYHECDHVITQMWRPRWSQITDPSAQYLSV